MKITWGVSTRGICSSRVLIESLAFARVLLQLSADIVVGNDSNIFSRVFDQQRMDLVIVHNLRGFQNTSCRADA